MRQYKFQLFGIFAGGFKLTLYYVLKYESYILKILKTLKLI